MTGNRLAYFTFAGQQVGTVVTFFLSGVVAEKFGWEWDFYLFGIFGALFCIAWGLLIHSTPAQHTRISEVTKYIYFERFKSVFFL